MLRTTVSNPSASSTPIAPASRVTTDGRVRNGTRMAMLRVRPRDRLAASLLGR
jgi:hypothetical protein